MTHETNDRKEKLIHIARLYGSKFAHRYPAYFPADSDIWPDCRKCSELFWVACQDLPAMCAGCGRDGWYGESCICDGDEVEL